MNSKIYWNNCQKAVNFLLNGVQRGYTNENIKYLRDIIELLIFLDNDTFSISYEK